MWIGLRQPAFMGMSSFDHDAERNRVPLHGSTGSGALKLVGCSGAGAGEVDRRLALVAVNGDPDA